MPNPSTSRKATPPLRYGLCFLLLLAVFLPPAPLRAQLQNRISTEIGSSGSSVRLKSTASPHAVAAHDEGAAGPSLPLTGMVLSFKPSAAQQAALDALVQAQQTPGSPSYHQWLTPAAYAARFGMSSDDLARVSTWLEQQGFAVDRVSESRNAIVFSGTVAQVEAAFSTRIDRYSVSGVSHYANATALSFPQALAGVVQGVGNLSSFRPHAHVRFHKNTQTRFTSSLSGSHYLTPKDLATIYDINPAYNAGYTGTGQSLAIVGQSEINTSDIENFQSAAGLATRDPTLVLVPDSGTAAFSSGDQAESDLDLEYSSAIAKGASVYFVYVGSDSNYSVFDSLEYAVDTDLAPIISISYGDCETDLSQSDYTTLNGVLEQAAAQGQTVVAAAGDDGSTDCYEDTNLTEAQRTALAVDFPASSQYVLGMGGSEFPSADVAADNTTYWASASGSDVISSALSYIPEQVWNDDDATYGISAGGGGVSTLTARPSWQTGVTGIPTGSYRLVPDLALTASPNNAGFLYCTSDTSGWSTGQEASCNSGFRDADSEDLTVAGGTSFDAPTFAGLVAILNQKVSSTGQGVIAATLYGLAASSTTYASAFHDITSGSNECTAGTKYCATAGESEYPAGTGYDEATGLGSIDYDSLLEAWPTTTTSTLAASTTTVSAASTAPASGASDVITITVAPESSSLTATPTGTLTISVDGSAVENALALTDGSASYTFSSTTAGSHVIKAVYSGDTNYASSSGSVSVSVASVASTAGSFTLSATAVTVAQGSSGTSTVTITPANGYTGTVGWEISSSPTLSNACYSIANATVSGTSAVTETLTIYTRESQCDSASLTGSTGRRLFRSAATRTLAAASAPRRPQPSGSPWNIPSAAGMLGIGLLCARIRRLRAFAAVLLLAVGIFSATGCGSSSNSSSSSTSTTSTDASQGTYTLTVVGADTATSTITASTTLTLTID